jgi:hypothetical protein
MEPPGTVTFLVTSTDQPTTLWICLNSQLTWANGTLPRYMIVTPDGNHDAHDCPVGMSSCTKAQKLAAADAFLSSTLEPILATCDFQPGGDGLIIVTFDECGGGTNQGCGASVYTALIGPKVIPHTVSTVSYKHENSLRTMLDSLGITTYPGAAATASDMQGFFTPDNSQPIVTVSTPVDNANVTSPVNVQASASPSTGHTISSWSIYVDGVGVYSAGAVTTINTNLTMSAGSHTLLVRAWDTSSAYGSQSLTVNVSGKPVVRVSKPANGSKVTSPINIQASATPTSGHSHQWLVRLR